LNNAGRAVARRLGADLALTLAPGGRIVSGPSRRARQTAAAIARTNRGARVEIDDRWCEADYGIAEGLTFDELAVVAPDIAERLSRGDVAIDWPGGETAASLGDRVTAAWRHVLELGVPAILVSHAGPLRHAIALATTAPLERVAIPGPGVVIRLADPVLLADPSAW
jgi:broad specificity phosphatase PhoE